MTEHLDNFARGTVDAEKGEEQEEEVEELRGIVKEEKSKFHLTALEMVGVIFFSLWVGYGIALFMQGSREDDLKHQLDQYEVAPKENWKCDQGPITADYEMTNFQGYPKNSARRIRECTVLTCSRHL